MQAWVRAFPNGCFAVTGIDGLATLQLSAHLLDGTYKIDAWHPRFTAPLETTVVVKNGTGTASFQFQGRSRCEENCSKSVELRPAAFCVLSFYVPSFSPRPSLGKLPFSFR